MASIVDICNGALNQLGASTIITLTEDSKNARLCNARFTQVRDSVFRSHPWNCLQKRVELAADTDTPAWGFTSQFTIPADCLRVLSILDFDSDHKIEGRKILTDNSSMKILTLDGMVIRDVQSNGLSVDGDQLKWDGKNSNGHKVSPGVYFCSVLTEYSHDVVKLIYLK